MYEIMKAFTEPAVIASVVLTFALQYVFKHLPPRVKSLLRGSRLKELRKLKSARRNPDEVSFQSMKAHAYFLVFMGTCALLLVLVTMGPLTVLLEYPLWMLLLVSCPVFMTEIAWLRQDLHAKNLIKSRHKLRIKSKQERLVKSRF